MKQSEASGGGGGEEKEENTPGTTWAITGQVPLQLERDFNTHRARSPGEFESEVEAFFPCSGSNPAKKVDWSMGLSVYD